MLGATAACPRPARPGRSVEQLERQRQDASDARRSLAAAERTFKMRAEDRDRLRHDLGLSGSPR
jgi:membrane protein